ncbi:MAG: hypothetical protein J6B22_01485 [Clostridia bacterium]|nr:hypothetical protein [Clostridia bacterium]
MRKKIILFTILAVILISFLSLIVFYAVSFEKFNTAIAYINKNGSSNSEETDWISISDLKKLQIVDDIFITEDNYIIVKTKNNVKFKSLGNVVYTVDVKAVVNDWETGSNVAECSGKLQIDFKFSDMKWRVVKVERVE